MNMCEYLPSFYGHIISNVSRNVLEHYKSDASTFIFFSLPYSNIYAGDSYFYFNTVRMCQSKGLKQMFRF